MYNICKTMLSYCLKCRKNKESKKPKVVMTKIGRILLLSKCTVVIVENQKLLISNKLKGY